MKKLILLTAVSLVLATVGVAWAQTGEAPSTQHARGPMSPDQKLQMMTKELNLTADQQAKIKPLLENESQQMQALRQNSSLSREDRMSQMQQIRQSTNQQIRSELNSDQQKKFQQTQMMGPHGHGGPPAGQPQPQ